MYINTIQKSCEYKRQRDSNIMIECNFFNFTTYLFVYTTGFP